MRYRPDYKVTEGHHKRFGLGSYDKTIYTAAHRAERNGFNDVGRRIREWRIAWYMPYGNAAYGNEILSGPPDKKPNR